MSTSGRRTIIPSRAVLVASLCACAGEIAPREAPQLPPYAELVDQGIARFLGMATPNDASTDETGVTTYTFAVEDGPMCLRGAPFSTSIRDQGADDLLIFLQGGGLCYSGLCLAIESAGDGIPPLDVLDPELQSNPVRDWNVAYLPYCDGSLFAGVASHDDDGDGVDERLHAGLANLSAALDLAHATFPEPRRILIAGSSGGGYGTLPASVLARLLWEETPIYVFNDAGVGLGRGNNPGFIRGIVDEFGAAYLMPASEPEMLSGGHLTPFIEWQLDQDPNLRIAAFSATEDFVISTLYLGVDGPTFHGWLGSELDTIASAHPDRFARYLAPGSIHTTLLGDPSGFVDVGSDDLDFIAAFLGSLDTTEVDGVRVSDWLAALVDETAAWTNVGE